jgi:phenylacetate-CoA ligase
MTRGDAGGLPAWLARRVFYPLWEIKNGSRRRQYLDALLKSQWWDAERYRNWQWDRLREAVHCAFANVPYYTARHSAVGFDGVLRSWEDFRRLPLLGKKDIRENHEALLSREFKRETLVEARTGGSTGTALTLFFDRRCQELRNAASMRSDQWAGRDVGMQVAAIWGNPPVARTLKEKLRELLLQRVIYLDTMHIDRDRVQRFVGEWRRTKPRVIFGHSHSIYVLARYLQELGIDDLRPTGIVSTSMMLLAP